jgi:hypothetical protein
LCAARNQAYGTRFPLAELTVGFSGFYAGVSDDRQTQVFRSETFLLSNRGFTLGPRMNGTGKVGSVLIIATKAGGSNDSFKLSKLDTCK